MLTIDYRKPALLISAFSLLFTCATANPGKGISFTVEYASYHNDFGINPSLIYSIKLITCAPLIHNTGVQFSYSKLPYFTADYPGLYKDKVTWFAMSFIKPISLRIDPFVLSVIPGVGTVIQSTWHDDLIHESDEPDCFGCGDYNTPLGFYLDYEIQSDIHYRFTSELELGIGFAFRRFLGPVPTYTDIYNPPALGDSFGTYITIGKNLH